jgi:hypothetical protein
MSPGREWSLFLAGLATALTIGWVGLPYVIYRPVEQPLSFSHKVHTGENVGLTCDDCHALLEDGRFAGTPSVETCAGCHLQAQGDTPNERVLVDQYVREGREIPWLGYSRQPENVHFPHSVHVRLAGIDCQLCHGDHGATDALPAVQINRLTGYSIDIWGHSQVRLNLRPGEGKKMDDCSGCHRRQRVEESCLDCHK